MSCDTLSRRIGQMKVKVQTAGDGCEWDEPQDSDLIKGLEYGWTTVLETETIESNIAKSTYSKEAQRTGIRWAQIDCSFRILAPDDYSTETINIHPLIIGNGNSATQVQRIPVSAIATGFVVGETVTGGTSSASGTVVKDTESTDTHIYVVNVTGGPFEAEALTGSINGAATATGAEANYGQRYTPISASQQKISVIFEEFAGFKTELYNGVFIGTVSVDDSGLASYVGQIIGAIRRVADVEQFRRDAAVVALDQSINIEPPIFRNAKYSIDDGSGAFVPVINGTAVFDSGAESTPRRNANSLTGLEGIFIGDRTSTHQVRFEQVANSEYDVYLERLNAGTSIIQYSIGETVGNIVYFHFPQATPFETGDGDQDNIVMVEANYSLVGDNDDEYSILTY